MNTHPGNKFYAFCVMLMSLLLVSCAADKPAKKHAPMGVIDEALQSSDLNTPRDRQSPSRQASINEKNINEALLPALNIDLPGDMAVDSEPRFDIKVNRARVKQFFMGLVEGTSYNMVLHPKVSGRITLDLKNVTVPEVMDVVRDIYGYDFEKTKTGYQVFPNTLSTRVFNVNYLDVKRKGKSQMRISSGQVTESPNVGRGIGSGSQSTSFTNSGATGSGNSNRSLVSGSEVETSSESTFWKELQKTIEVLLGDKKGRSAVVSPQSGIVVVRAMPNELRIVEKFIKKTEEVVERQVIIEAKIIEVELSDAFQAGINWSALKTTANNRYQLNQVGGGSIFGGTGLSSTAGNAGDLNPSALSQINGSATEALGGIFSVALNIGNDFSAFVELLQTQGDVQVLSSPKVSTISNQKAVIKVGQDEFFITDVQSNTNIATGTSSTYSNVELTPFFTGVALDVTPQISDNNEIILHIHPSVSKVSEKVKDIGLGDTLSLSVPLAVSTIRESDSIIRAKSGQVVVLGGLMQDALREEDASVPFLSDLPLIGGLFKHVRMVKKKSELVILLKPVVVETNTQWADAINSSKKRLDSIYGR